VASALETLVAAVHADAAMAGVDYEIHRLKLKELDSPPKYVWVHMGGTIGATDQVGGRVYSGRRDRVVRTDEARCEVHIWGESYEQAEDMLYLLVATLWRIASGSVAFGGYTIFNEQPATAEYALAGVKLVLDVTVTMPITSEQKSLTTITTAVKDGQFIDRETGSVTDVC
jgi:hypothetical protein